MSEKQRSYWELTGLVLTGFFHIVIEQISIYLNYSGPRLYGPDYIYNMMAVVAWVGYVTYRTKKDRTLWKQWGFRLDNIKPAALWSLGFAVIAGCLLGGYGYVIKGYRYPFLSLMVIFSLYPLWGLAQQFALQVFANRNLRTVGLYTGVRILFVACLFSISHFPNYPLMGLVFLLGLFATVLYDRYPNFWVLSVLHGFLGGMAYFFILGEDPAAPIIAALSRFFG